VEKKKKKKRKTEQLAEMSLQKVQQSCRANFAVTALRSARCRPPCDHGRLAAILVWFAARKVPTSFRARAQKKHAFFPHFQYFDRTCLALILEPRYGSEGLEVSSEAMSP